MVIVLKPLHDLFDIKRVVVSTYQSVSGAGKASMDELIEQTRDILAEKKVSLNDFIIKAVGKIQSQSTSNPSSISQAAAVEALNGKQGFIKTRAKAFRERRNFVVKSLNNINGISCTT